MHTLAVALCFCYQVAEVAGSEGRPQGFMLKLSNTSAARPLLKLVRGLPVLDIEPQPSGWTL